MKSLDAAIVMGSDSDWEKMSEAKKALENFGLSAEMKILSAHRAPVELVEYIKECESRGAKIFIAGAGLAAHLPGVVAAHTDRPVVGVPLSAGPLNGQDALLSIVQMPKGVPVATVAIDGAWNAGLLSCQILATSNDSLRNKFKSYRDEMRKKVLSKNS